MVAQGRPKIESGLFEDLLQSGHRRSGRLAECRGQLHDYYFPYISGIAIHYGLVPADRAGPIMDRLLAKMKEVGFNRFDLGLPGNLVAIPLKDYKTPEKGAVRRRHEGRRLGGISALRERRGNRLLRPFRDGRLIRHGPASAGQRNSPALLGAFDRNDSRAAITSTVEGSEVLGRRRSATKATWSTSTSPAVGAGPRGDAPGSPVPPNDSEMRGDGGLEGGRTGRVREFAFGGATGSDRGWDDGGQNSRPYRERMPANP